MANSEIIASGVIDSAGLVVNINKKGSYSITFGNKVIFNKGGAISISAVYDSAANKIIIAYADGYGFLHGKAIVGTVVNDTIIFGNPVVFNDNGTDNISIAYDPTNGKIIIAYSDDGLSCGTAIVGTINEDSIIFGDPVVFNSNSTSFISTTYDSTNNKVIIAYCNVRNSFCGTVIVGTIDADSNSISFGNPVVFNKDFTWEISTGYDPINSKIVIAYKNVDKSDYGTAIVGTVDPNNNTISFGAPVVFNRNQTTDISICYASANNKVIIAYPK